MDLLISASFLGHPGFLHELAAFSPWMSCAAHLVVALAQRRR
jgi:hypothetical protein